MERLVTRCNYSMLRTIRIENVNLSPKNRLNQKDYLTMQNGNEQMQNGNEQMQNGNEQMQNGNEQMQNGNEQMQKEMRELDTNNTEDTGLSEASGSGTQALEICQSVI